MNSKNTLLDHLKASPMQLNRVTEVLFGSQKELIENLFPEDKLTFITLPFDYSVIGNIKPP